MSLMVIRGLPHAVGRPSIKASSYMILRTPADLDKNVGTRQAYVAAVKLRENKKLWDLAAEAMAEVDPECVDS